MEDNKNDHSLYGRLPCHACQP